MAWYVGVDWGSKEHAVCVLDEKGKRRREWRVRHDRAGLKGLVETLSKLAGKGDVRIGVERPSGLLVETIVEAGFVVVPLRPEAVHAARALHRAARSKDDTHDAFVIADMIRQGLVRERPLQPRSDAVRAIRALSHMRMALVEQRVATTNQLRACLEGFWPMPLELFCELDSKISLEFLTRYPDPLSAKDLDERVLVQFLKEQSYTGRTTKEQFRERMAGAPEGTAGAQECRAKALTVRLYVELIQKLNAQIKALEAELEESVGSHPDGALLRSFPGVRTVTAGMILGEIGDSRGRFDSGEHLAAEAGVVPVTQASGKSRTVGPRRACNRHLKRAITTFADNSRKKSEWAQCVYARARERGRSHAHAIRILSRGWLRVLWRCWQDRKQYDPSSHGAATRAA